MSSCLWLAAAAAAQTAASPVRVQAVENGRIERHGDLRVVRTWGTPAQRGRAHGLLLGQDIGELMVAEFGARFARWPEFRELARKSLSRLIEFPDDVHEELEALFAGIKESGADLRSDALDCDLDFIDLQIANALDVFGLMSCTGFTVWGDQVEGGGVLTGRNFDWPLSIPNLIDDVVVLVQHPTDGCATASVTWPGYIAILTGINSAGVAAFLHVGSGLITVTPEPSSWPTGIALREILQASRGADAAGVFRIALDRLGYTSPPAGYLSRIVLPRAPADGSPLGLFESCSMRVLQAELTGPCAVSNHFQGRDDGRDASPDSLDRLRRVKDRLAGCLDSDDKKVSVAEGWQMLESVQSGGRRFGTLHSLVFRNEPWCFELRIAEQRDGKLIAAPVGRRRHELTREALFPADPAVDPGPAGQRR